MRVQKLAQILLQNAVLEKIPTVQSDNHFLLLQTNVHTQFVNYTSEAVPKAPVWLLMYCQITRTGRLSFKLSDESVTHCLRYLPGLCQSLYKVYNIFGNRMPFTNEMVFA